VVIGWWIYGPMAPVTRKLLTGNRVMEHRKCVDIPGRPCFVNSSPQPQPTPTPRPGRPPGVLARRQPPHHGIADWRGHSLLGASLYTTFGSASSIWVFVLFDRQGADLVEHGVEGNFEGSGLSLDLRE
jgi:hypothetical protein